MAEAIDPNIRAFERLTHQLIRTVFLHAREPTPERAILISQLEAKRDALQEQLFAVPPSTPGADAR